MSLPCSSQLITALIRQLSTVPIPSTQKEEDPVIEDPQPHRRDKRANDAPNDNPLAKLPADTLAKVKPLLLTLHSIFPNELLLALDVLDRKLVTRYTVQPDTSQETRGDGNREEQEAQLGLSEDKRDAGGIYFVKSSTAPATSTNNNGWHSHPQQIERSYEVCLNSWNCTCPAFALATFQELASGSANDEASRRPGALERHETVEGGGQEQKGDCYAGDGRIKSLYWIFGGKLTQSPTCSKRCAFMHDSPAICKHLLACVLCSQCPGLFDGGVSFVHISREELAARHAGWAG